MKAHGSFFNRDYDVDGIKIVCPKWLWAVYVIADADPVHCPMCGDKLPKAAHEPSTKEVKEEI